MPEEKKEDAGATARAEWTVDYIKSNQYRVVHVDGFFGGPTPSGKILITVWNERFPIPKSVAYAADREGTKEVSRTGREAAIVREVEVGCLMDPGTAIALMVLLESQLKQAGLLPKKEEADGSAAQEA